MTSHVGLDRSRRIAILGALAILAGAGGVALGVLHLALPLLAPESGDWRSAWMGVLTWVPLGVVVAWTGLGAVRLRRWVRPVMLVLAWTWLVAGALAAAWVAWSAADLVVMATASMEPAPPADVAGAVRWGLIAGTTVAGVALPLLFVWGFTGEDTRRTLDAHDPGPGWTDACPLPVLGLSLGLWLGALVTLPLLLRPVVPLSGRLWTGAAGAGLIAAAAAIAVALGVSTYRLQPAGWWATCLALALLGVSTAWTLPRVDLLDVYRALGYPDDYVAAMTDSALARPGPLVAATLALTGLSLGYMLAIRRWFGSKGDDAP